MALDGWMDGWMGVRAGLRIANTNQQELNRSVKTSTMKCEMLNTKLRRLGFPNHVIDISQFPPKSIQLPKLT